MDAASPNAAVPSVSRSPTAAPPSTPAQAIRRGAGRVFSSNAPITIATAAMSLMLLASTGSAAAPVAPISVANPAAGTDRSSRCDSASVSSTATMCGIASSMLISGTEVRCRVSQ